MVNLEILQPGGPDWHEQFGRVLRWYKRLHQISKQSKNVSQIDIEDYFHVFFQECYHLKYWIVNGKYKTLYKEIENELNENTHMILCDHLANSMKHKLLDRNTKRRHKIKHFELHRGFYLTIVKGNPKKSHGAYKWIVGYDGQEIDGIELAKKCVEFWENTIRTYKIR